MWGAKVMRMCTGCRESGKDEPLRGGGGNGVTRTVVLDGVSRKVQVGMETRKRV